MPQKPQGSLPRWGRGGVGAVGVSREAPIPAFPQRGKEPIANLDLLRSEAERLSFAEARVSL